MRATDAQEIVENARVDPLYYSIGSERHEALCLTEEGGTWKVFLSERGQRYEEQEFATDEDAACVYFLKRLFRLWRPR